MHTSLDRQEGDSFLPNTLSLANELLGDILTTVRSINSFTIELETLRNYQIMELSSDISRFVEVTTLLSKVILTKNKDLMLSVKESHMSLLFVMKGINLAQQKQDLVALEELIKYELKDNLTQWKIDLIPQTKRLLQARPST